MTRATDVFETERSGEAVVCKRLVRRAASEGWMRERLAAEARLLEAIAGRGAPRLAGHGEDERGPWLEMERIAWPTLATRTGACEPSWIAAAAASAFEALALVHEARDASGPLDVVHADVSPANVLVADAGDRAALVDFDLARWRDAPAMPPGPFRGTLAYAAPEVARGDAFDARADAFSLAASLLATLSGSPPRAGESEAALLLRAGEESIEAWASAAARPLAARVRDALLACCAFDPRARPARARDVCAMARS